MSSNPSVCGDFETPIHPDLGQCFPYRLKLDCVEVEIEQSEAGEGIGGVCGPDPELEVEIHPELTPPIRTITSIYDEDCEQILDENNDPITGPTI